MDSLTPQMLLFFAVLGVTVTLFVFEWLRVDVVALLVMVALPWLGLVEPKQALAGLSSNAVVSIIGVMILGHGIDRTGVMNRLTRPVIAIAGASEKRLLALVSLSVGTISAFMQNIGAAALFLPAVLRIARKLDFSPSRILMPMGFAAILGGTLTMVASGPLILLNDLLRGVNQEPYGLFAVTPVGLALLATGVLYFLLFGGVVLPRRGGRESGGDTQQALIETWGLPSTIRGVVVMPESSLVGCTIEEARLWQDYRVNLVALAEGEERVHAPWRYTRFRAGQELALLGDSEQIERLIEETKLGPAKEVSALLEELRGGESAGFAEVVVRPHAPKCGQSIRQIALRKTYQVEPVALLAGEKTEHRDFSDEPLQPGYALVVHGRWEKVRALGDDPSFALLTPVSGEAPLTSKGWLAVLCFLGAVGFAVAGFPLSISLLSGALVMVITRVITIDEAYRAVDWRTVFLLAGLIPLGVAMERTGAAQWIANGAASALSGAHPLVVLGAVGVMATLFSLFMSNVAATVLLVPLVAQLGASAGVSPRALGLLVAVCASNSFVLPTHQVNALLMSPGGYRNADYLRAGGVMTLLFLAVVVSLTYALYLG